MHLDGIGRIAPRHILVELGSVRVVLGVVEQRVVDVGVARAAPHGQVGERQAQRVRGGARVRLHVPAHAARARRLQQGARETLIKVILTSKYAGGYDEKSYNSNL